MRWISLPEALEFVGQLVGPGQKAVSGTDPRHIVLILLPKQGGTKAEAQQAKEALDHPRDQIGIGCVWGHTPGQMISRDTDVVVIGPGAPTMEQDARGTVYRVDSVADLPKVKIAKRPPPPHDPAQFHLEQIRDAYLAGDVLARKRNPNRTAEVVRPEQCHRINWQTGTVGVGTLEIDRESLIRTFAVADQSPSPPEMQQQRGRKPKGATRDGEIMREFDRMFEAGEVSLGHGGQAEAVTNLLLLPAFKDYTRSGIEKIIRKTYNEYKQRALASG